MGRYMGVVNGCMGGEGVATAGLHYTAALQSITHFAIKSVYTVYKTAI